MCSFINIYPITRAIFTTRHPESSVSLVSVIEEEEEEEEEQEEEEKVSFFFLEQEEVDEPTTFVPPARIVCTIS